MTNSNLLLTLILLACMGLAGVGTRGIIIFIPALTHLPRALNKYYHSATGWKALQQGAVIVVLNKFKALRRHDLEALLAIRADHILKF